MHWYTASQISPFLSVGNSLTQHLWTPVEAGGKVNSSLRTMSLCKHTQKNIFFHLIVPIKSVKSLQSFPKVSSYSHCHVHVVNDYARTHVLIKYYIFAKAKKNFKLFLPVQCVHCSYGAQLEFFIIEVSKILWHCPFKI